MLNTTRRALEALHTIKIPLRTGPAVKIHHSQRSMVHMTSGAEVVYEGHYYSNIGGVLDGAGWEDYSYCWPAETWSEDGWPWYWGVEEEVASGLGRLLVSSAEDYQALVTEIFPSGSPAIGRAFYRETSLVGRLWAVDQAGLGLLPDLPCWPEGLRFRQAMAQVHLSYSGYSRITGTTLGAMGTNLLITDWPDGGTLNGGRLMSGGPIWFGDYGAEGPPNPEPEVTEESTEGRLCLMGLDWEGEWHPLAWSGPCPMDEWAWVDITAIVNRSLAARGNYRAQSVVVTHEDAEEAYLPGTRVLTGQNGSTVRAGVGVTYQDWYFLGGAEYIEQPTVQIAGAVGQWGPADGVSWESLVTRGVPTSLGGFGA